MIQTGYSQTTTVGTTTNANGAPIPVNWDNAFITTPIIEPVGNAPGRQTFSATAISFFNQDPKVSKQLRWQIGFQRELPGGFTVEAAYVGNYGYDIEITRNINALPIQYLNTDNSRTAAMTANNTFLRAPSRTRSPGCCREPVSTTATIARSQLLLPYPEFGTINTTNNDGKSWYSAGQFGVQKRFSKGYTLGVSYTYSKWMQATEYLNAADPNPTKMISDLDVTHRLSISGIYAFPFGKGKQFLSDASGVMEASSAAGRFRASTRTRPASPSRSDDSSTTAPPSRSRTTTTAKWFNTDVFTSILTDPGPTTRRRSTTCGRSR